MMSFTSLGLSKELLRTLEEEGYVEPTPIQELAIPPLLEGRDVLGVAQTGTGKTAAFALPVLQRIANSDQGGHRNIRALILSPTRELAAQIGERFSAYGANLPLYHHVIFGGVSQKPQVKAVKRGIDILTATPGRLLDLISQGHIDISNVEFFVLDEADRMLDMGFIRDIRKILKMLPKTRQNLLFSATMPNSISELAGSFLRDAVRVEVTPEEVAVDRIDQHILFVKTSDKKYLLTTLIKERNVDKAIVFTRTKHGANRLVKQLGHAEIEAVAIHGNKSQGARTKALSQFKSGEIPILIATDIASRGIDVDGISHVFNFDLPNIPESYVHRIGRTARAGKSGSAFGFCDDTESGYLVGIQRLLGHEIPVIEDHPYHFPKAIPKPGQKPGEVRKKKSRHSRAATRKQPDLRRERSDRRRADEGRSPRGHNPNRGRHNRPKNHHSNSSQKRGNRGNKHGSNRSRNSGGDSNRGQRRRRR